MARYNISSFMTIMQSGLIENNGQEVAGRLLLDSIARDEEVDVSKDMISNLVKQKSEVHHKIKKASARPEVMKVVIQYFEKEVVTDLNPNLEDDTCTDIIRALKADPSVSEAKREELLSLYQDGKLGEFFAKSFLYAIGKPNKLNKKNEPKAVGTYSAVDDVPLIYEVNNRCPICLNLLTQSTAKGRTARGHTIVNIYPNDLNSEHAKLFQEARKPDPKLDSNDNKIALCHGCAKNYTLDTELKEYTALFDLKQRYVKSYRMKQKLNQIGLEEDIREVIRAFEKIDQTQTLQELSLEALEIKQKIHPENVILLEDLKNDILRYYRFIEKTFSRIDRFDLIAAEIRVAFYQIESDCSDQNDVMEQLTKWMLEKADMPQKRTLRRACEVIIAFFVQNSEVFYEL